MTVRMAFLRWEGHSVQVMRLVTKLYRNVEFTDCILDTEGGIIYGHKTLLAGCSPYLKKLFMDHPGMKVLPLKHLRYDDMKLILDFVYYGQVVIQVTDNMTSLMKTAELLQITSLMCACLNFSEKLLVKGCAERSLNDSGMMCNEERNLSSRGNEIISEQCVLYGKRDGLREEVSEPETMIKANASEQNIIVPEFCFVNVTSEGEEEVSLLAEEEEEESSSDSSWMMVHDVKGERDFQAESKKQEAVIGVSGCSMEIAQVTEMGCLASEMKPPVELVTTKDGFNVILVPERNEVVTYDRTFYSEDCIVEGTGDVELKLESICSVSESDLKEEKVFETALDTRGVDDEDQNRLLSSSFEDDSGAEKSSQEGVDKGLGVGSASGEVKLEESAVVIEVVNMSHQVENSAMQQFATCGSLQPPTEKSLEEQKNEKQMHDSRRCQDSKVTLHSEQSQSIKNRKLTSRSSAQFECNICGLSFSCQGNLRKHKYNHTGFSCYVCKASFSTRDNLLAHKRLHTGEKPFPCVFCAARYIRKSALRKHLLTHTGEKPFLCDVCGRSFSSKVSLTLHTRCHTNEKPFACVTCKATFVRQQGLRSHMKQMHCVERPHCCTLCDASFRCQSNLKKHMVTHTGERPYSCNWCGASFGLKCTLKAHEQTHTGVKPFACGLCEASFARRVSLRYHMRTHTGEKPFSCDICKASFAFRVYLKTHMLIHSVDKPHLCTLCDKSYKDKRNLRSHMLKHSSEKLYPCGTCNASFKLRNVLKKHERLHTGERPYVCGVCGATFAWQNCWKNHMKVHSDEKPFACDTCKRTFRLKNSLRNHMRIHTGENAFLCSICEASFSWRQSLKKHMRLHTGEKPFSCDICKARFAQKAQLRTHMKHHTV